MIETANSNEIRGLLAEYGIVIAVGVNQLYRALPVLFDLDNENALSATFKELLARHYQKLTELTAHLDFYTQKIHVLSQNEECQLLQMIPGFGAIVASAFYHHVGTAAAFKNGRAVAASVGLVPKQHSSGGKERLQGLTHLSISSKVFPYISRRYMF